MASTAASKRLLELVARAVSAERTGPRAVAYSGGRDSGVLLWALSRLVEPGTLTALHVDHGWRSPQERSQERNWVTAYCSRLGVELRTFAPPEDPITNEADARRHRYHCFGQWVNDHPGGLVYLAHHADDQAETILMRLLQGRSWSGLGGMPSRRGPYRRPLLSVDRELLGRVAEDQALGWHEDSTNLGTGPLRNFLRHDALPLLKTRFPRASLSLVEFGAHWAEGRPIRPLDGAWVVDDGGARVAPSVWDAWTVGRRQEQLLAVVSLRGAGRVSRRFLEAVCVDGRRGAARGQGWAWSRGEVVSWERRTPGPSNPFPNEYFIVARPGRWYELPEYRWRWEREGPGTLVLEAVDASRPWVWRTWTPGLPLTSQDGEWTREQRKKRLKGGRVGSTVLVLQDGLVRAVVDPIRKSLLWVETTAEKLHKGGIFVTLLAVTRNLTE